MNSSHEKSQNVPYDLQSSHEKSKNVPYDTHFLLHNVTSSLKFYNFSIFFHKLSEGLRNKTVFLCLRF